jgi:hypothetical protein
MRSVRHRDTRLYHGPIELPVAVIGGLDGAPVYRTTHRHSVLRLELDGVAYLFRRWTLGHHYYLGEVVRTQTGRLRVHLFRSTDRGRPLQEILESLGPGGPGEDGIEHENPRVARIHRVLQGVLGAVASGHVALDAVERGYEKLQKLLALALGASGPESERAWERAEALAHKLEDLCKV